MCAVVVEVAIRVYGAGATSRFTVKLKSAPLAPAPLSVITAESAADGALKSRLRAAHEMPMLILVRPLVPPPKLDEPEPSPPPQLVSETIELATENGARICSSWRTALEILSIASVRKS